MDKINNIAKEIKILAQEINDLRTAREKISPRYNKELEDSCIRLYMAVANYNDCKKPYVETRPEEKK